MEALYDVATFLDKAIIACPGRSNTFELYPLLRLNSQEMLRLSLFKNKTSLCIQCFNKYPLFIKEKTKMHTVEKQIDIEEKPTKRE